MVEKTIEQRGGDDGVAEDLTPFGKASVGREDHCAALVAGVDELKEQIAAAGNDRQVSDLIDDEQREATEESYSLSQCSLAFGFGERADEVAERREVNASSSPDCLHTERQRQVTFAGAGRAKEMYDFFAIDELQLGQRHNAVLVERRLEGKVEACECLDGGEPGHDESGLDAPVLAQHQFLREQRIDGLDRGDLALLDATQSDIQDLDGARHLEPDHGLFDALDKRSNNIGMHAYRQPPFASRRAMAS